MKKGDEVRLRTFNGKTHAEEVTDSSEDYWKLIGETGTIQQDPQEESIYASFSQEPRVLIRFDKDVAASYGLVAHNNIENSLWILASDLELIKT